MSRIVVRWSQLYTAPAGFSTANPEFRLLRAYWALLFMKAIGEAQNRMEKSDFFEKSEKS